MAIQHKIWQFPSIPIAKQLFHVPGAAADGGFTIGGARITSPEPGGFGVLEMQPSLQVDEWSTPWASWIMSKTNSQIFRVRLTKTPQLISSRSIVAPSMDAYPRDQSAWHAPKINNDLKSSFVANALEGSNVLVIDMRQIGAILQVGHVVGHGDNTYLVDEIAYDSVGRASVVVTPPIRKNVKTGDVCLFTPYFLGSIINGGEIKASYDAENIGNIQLEKIVFSEIIVP